MDNKMLCQISSTFQPFIFHSVLIGLKSANPSMSTNWTYPCLVSVYCAPFPTHIKFFQDLGRIDIPIQAWVCTGERRSWSWLCRNTWSLSIFGTDYYSPSLFCTNNIKLRDLKKEKQRNKDFDLLFKRIKTMSYVLLLQPVIFWIFQT